MSNGNEIFCVNFRDIIAIKYHIKPESGLICWKRHGIRSLNSPIRRDGDIRVIQSILLSDCCSSETTRYYANIRLVKTAMTESKEAN
jgi:hypothetical protein